MVNGVKLLYNVSAATVNQIDENLFFYMNNQFNDIFPFFHGIFSLH